jgi:hypothetical protein
VTALAIVFLLLSILLVWGGLVASTLFLRSHAERTSFPPGGLDDHREDAAPLEHDT